MKGLELNIMFINVVWYLSLTGFYTYNQKWVMVLYWFSAAGITTAAIFLAKGYYQ